MLNITHYQRNANQNHNEVPLHLKVYFWVTCLQMFSTFVSWLLCKPSSCALAMEVLVCLSMLKVAGTESVLASLISSKNLLGNLIPDVAMVALAHLHIIPMTPVFLSHSLDTLGHISISPFPLFPSYDSSEVLAWSQMEVWQNQTWTS